MRFLSILSLFLSISFYGATKRLLEKTKITGKISRNNMKIIGVFFGNNGMVMRYAQRITKSSLGLLFSRSGNKQKKLGCSKVNIRIKKTL